MWAKIIATLTGQTVESVLKYKRAKVELKAEIELEKLRGKAAYEMAKTKRAAESEGLDHEWEIESIRNSGFKDEWVLFMLSIPMVMSFIPGLVVYVQMGFSALSQTPDWYRWLILLIFTAIYGIRIWRRDVMPTSEKK